MILEGVPPTQAVKPDQIAQGFVQLHLKPPVVEIAETLWAIVLLLGSPHREKNSCYSQYEPFLFQFMFIVYCPPTMHSDLICTESMELSLLNLLQFVNIFPIMEQHIIGVI